MKNRTLLILGLLLSFVLGIFTMSFVTDKKLTAKNKTEALKLGAFSMSLNVKSLKDSKQFYEYLGFSVLAGSFEKNYLILKNENTLIGLFQGMFEGNILTFNPGWDERGQNIKNFDDIRIIEQQLKSKGVKIDLEIDSSTTGPASLMLTDPDGNIILFDQHR
jgi:catechol 2,3-dioxygenase-like lactoylglutathione lyase family enzyme